MNDLLELKPLLNDQFDWEPMPDGCLLYCAETGQILAVNPLAELILTCCDGATPLEQVYAQFAAEMPVTREVFFETVQKFITEKVLLTETP